jgi:hypothetical protein
MPTLVSPGVSVSVIDESMYASAGQGTVPLVVVATAQDKTDPSTGNTAVGTTSANVGKQLLANHHLNHYKAQCYMVMKEMNMVCYQLIHI